MYGTASARARFVGDSVATASPGTLLTMLYDRLVLDLERAEQAQSSGDRAVANVQLLHAQDIVAELLSSLDTTVWDGAAGLASLYRFLLVEMVGANVSGDAARTRSCRTLVEPLRDAWHEAAQTAARSTSSTHFSAQTA